MRLYPGMAHTINQEELEAVRTIMHGVLEAARET
jgi:hypothetical protein